IQRLYLQKKILVRRNQWLAKELKSIFSEKIQLESKLESLEKIPKEIQNKNTDLVRSYLKNI
ncbi:hypothetical protein, partial [Leptospira weilii]